MESHGFAIHGFQPFFNVNVKPGSIIKKDTLYAVQAFTITLLITIRETWIALVFLSHTNG